MTYILNVGAAIAHLEDSLGEECNTDQIETKRFSQSVPEGYSVCEHCDKKRLERRAEALGFPTDDELLKGNDPKGPEPIGILNSSADKKEDVDGR